MIKTQGHKNMNTFYINRVQSYFYTNNFIKMNRILKTLLENKKQFLKRKKQRKTLA